VVFRPESRLKTLPTLKALAAAADASFTLPRAMLDEVIAKQTSFSEAVVPSRECNAARRVDGADGRIPAHVRNRRAEAEWW
jgi:hypothetical protein